MVPFCHFCIWEFCSSPDFLIEFCGGSSLFLFSLMVLYLLWQKVLSLYAVVQFVFWSATYIFFLRLCIFNWNSFISTKRADIKENILFSCNRVINKTADSGQLSPDKWRNTVRQIITDVSDEPTVSVLVLSSLHLCPSISTRPTLLPGWWRQHAPPRHYVYTKLRGVTYQNTVVII